MIQASKSMLRFYELTMPLNENNLLVIRVDMQITSPRTFFVLRLRNLNPAF